MNFLPLFTTTLDELSEHKTEIREKIREESGLPGLVVENFLSREECEEILQGVYTLEPYWRSGTCEGEFTLGRSWYTSIDNREVMDYFDEAPALNQLLQTTFPGLMARILAFGKTMVGHDNVQFRPGFAGPGIVVFKAHCTTAESGGSCHIDYEGLSKHQMDARDGVEIFSFMLPLSLPEKAGGLRVWPEVYERFRHNRYFEEIEEPEGEKFIIPYCVGNLFGIHSLRVHQIEPFGGEKDRVVVTFHLAQLDGQWSIWF